MVESHFGSRHQLYAVFANAMGGAKLKTKYETKEVYRKEKCEEHGGAPPSKKKRIKKKTVKKESNLPSINTRAPPTRLASEMTAPVSGRDS